MRATWRGSVAVGLVSFPVRLTPVRQERGVRLHQVHRADGGRVRHRRVCELCGEELAVAEVARGYDSGDGVVLVEDEELAGVRALPSRAVEVVQFCPAGQVDPVLLGRAYYVEPEEPGTGSYSVLREVLERGGLVGIARVPLRGREVVAVLRPRGGVLVLQVLVWAEEVREPDFVVPVAVSGERELGLAASLVGAMTEDFDPTAFPDAHSAGLSRVVADKLAERRREQQEREPAEPAEVPEVDIPASRAPDETGGELLAALRRSLERLRGGRR
ncbi:non-homologous end joining protein Ku [Actinosynnema pretiosum]|uniref:Non-homologous end joining protein Ku n=1 Tax=Actinosynnema pretiosum TaxID=42197 RepID=A0A290Z749_9PSEU|nr:Ku protein [Actinosynnema pretiosum]ATE54826.1 Ku protein [Actinosynnema pretiosum]